VIVESEDEERWARIMTKTVEVKMTTRGFEVTTHGGTAAFARMDEAFEFAQKRLEAAWQLRDLSRRCE
jgi:hypothetical protein